jgi:hypothetical protein
MFASSEPSANYDVYFSPAAAELASILISNYGGTSCARPTVPLSLLVGHADAHERLLVNFAQPCGQLDCLHAARSGSQLP